MKANSSRTQPGGGLEFELLSPDGNYRLEFFRQKNDAERMCLLYQVSYKSTPIILSSELEIQLDNHLSELALAQPVEQRDHWCENLIPQEVERTSRDVVWEPVYGERSRIRDCYNQMTVRLVKDNRPNYEVHLVFRAYNEGIAFRYYFPEDPTSVYYHIVAENTAFTLPPETKAWVTPWAQGPYRRLPLHDWPDESERPLTLELANGLYVCLAEAAMVDYARTNFKLHPTLPDTIVTSLYSSVDTITPFGTPWRVIMAADTPGRLLENNDILLNLNDSCAIEDTSWIKPGKVMRSMKLSTASVKACIDFAAAHNVQYVEIDWGWYGVERQMASDARQVNVDPRLNPKGDLDLHEVIAYGNEKNIGIILYVNQRALLRQIDDILPLYKSWGVKGVKFGFVQVGSHRWSVWLHEAVKMAADYELLVDIHDEYRPTGFSRTYPNLLTQEGIRGNEEMPDAAHNATLPFTRFIAGAADYTISYYKQKGIGDFHGKLIQTTSAHQLALAAINYSPLQFLFWYDLPSDYQGEPEIEFFEKIPTVWDETRVLNGRIGEFITVTRRRGKEWFLGAITDCRERRISVPLDFLEQGKRYTAVIYRDDTTLSTRTRVRVERVSVTAAQELTMELLPSGGQAVWFKVE
jgi:alpha-glucosidase